MSLTVSKRLERVKPSPTMTVSALATELRRQGKPVIDLAAGEPDFDTPDHIRAAAVEAIRKGKTKYTPVDGTAALKAAIVEKFQSENGLKYGIDEIVVSCGAKQACFNVAMAALSPGDEAIIPAPYWVSYPDIVRLADAQPVIIPTTMKDGFKITPSTLRSALTGKTRLIFLNSPSNPTGAAYTRAEWQGLGEVLEAYPEIIIAADEIYEHIYWGREPHVSFAAACPALRDRTVTINGVSKCYAMTGWRIGYAAAPKVLVSAMKTLQSQSTSSPCSISQAATVAALQGDQTCVRQMNNAFRDRHEFIIDALNNISGFNCLSAAGAFYAFPDVSHAMRNLGTPDDTAFAELLLRRVEVAVVPGSAFGAPGHVRLSFACSIDTLKDAVTRLRTAVS